MHIQLHLTMIIRSRELLEVAFRLTLTYSPAMMGGYSFDIFLPHGSRSASMTLSTFASQNYHIFSLAVLRILNDSRIEYLAGSFRYLCDCQLEWSYAEIFRRVNQPR
jgi:hypothetical protein